MPGLTIHQELLLLDNLFLQTTQEIVVAHNQSKSFQELRAIYIRRIEIRSRQKMLKALIQSGSIADLEES